MAVIDSVPRLPFAATNAVFALAVLVSGVGIVVAAGYFNTDRFLNSPGDLNKWSDSLVTLMMFAGLLMIINSMMGMSVIKVRSLHLSRCYGLLLVPSFIMLLVCAINFGAVIKTSDKGLQSLCSETVFQEDALKDLYKPYKNEIDGVIVPLTSKWMCSKQCACDLAAAAPWTAISESDL